MAQYLLQRHLARHYWQITLIYLLWYNQAAVLPCCCMSPNALPLLLPAGPC